MTKYKGLLNMGVESTQIFIILCWKHSIIIKKTDKRIKTAGTRKQTKINVWGWGFTKVVHFGSTVVKHMMHLILR